MNKIQNKYNQMCLEPSDINEHLPTLYKYALECDSIIETGVRSVVSSWALVNGLLNNNSTNRKKLLLNDINVCNITELLSLTSNENIDINYIWKSNLKIELNQKYDMIFIDTWHVYGQLIRELNKFSPYINKYIIMHDTTVDGIYGETIRCCMDAVKQSIDNEFPIHEINKGLSFAIDDFLLSNPEWTIKEVFTNNNGLTILEKKLY
jgi:hypothetical protein